MSKLPENCPVCGEKMEKGYVFATGHEIGWTKYRSRRFKKYDTLIRGFLQAPKTEACRCPSCKIVLFSYEKE